MAHLTLGVRNNAVGIRHAGWLTSRIGEVHPALRVELHPITTTLDRQRGAEPIIPGRTPGGSEELWKELREGTIDCAWIDLRESMWPLPDGLDLITCFARRSPRDALLHKQAVTFAKLPPSSRLSTTSLVTRMQIAAIRPDIVWVPLTGDLPTRLHKVHLQQVDGVVEPASDLLILGFDEKAFQYLPTDTVLPSPGQAAWGICALRERADIGRLMEPFEDAKARLCATAELLFAAEIGLPETAPVGAWARAQRKKLMLDACVLPPGSTQMQRLSISGPPGRCAELVSALVGMFRQQGIDRTPRLRK